MERRLRWAWAILLPAITDMSSPMRILIVGCENTRLYALSGYLAFQGFVVDHADDVFEARALLEHLDYSGLVARITVGDHEHTQWNGLLNETRVRGKVRRTVALIQETPLAAPSVVPWPDADLILGAELPILQLATAVCDSLAA